MSPVCCTYSTFDVRPGYVRKAIPQYREIHERYVSFELLEKLYERLQSPQHRHAIIKACKPPRLDADGTYVVHLAPLGTPCTGPPDNEEELAAAVAGVLRGLAALHAEGMYASQGTGAVDSLTCTQRLSLSVPS